MRLPVGVRASLAYVGVTTPIVELVMGDKILGTMPIVKADDEHRNFILSTWVRSYQNTARKFLDKNVYAAEEALVAEKFWRNTHCAVSPDDQYTIHGWVCASDVPSPAHVYHAYVPPDLRRIGLASALIQHISNDSTLYMARPSDWQPKSFSTKLNPYILRGDR